MLLHQRANHADQKQKTAESVPRPLNMKQAAEITFAQSKRRPLQSIIYLYKKKFIGTSSILAQGKSPLLPIDPLFTLQIVHARIRD